MSIYWNIASSDDGQSIAITLPDYTTLAIPGTHPRFTEIRDYLLNADLSTRSDEEVAERLHELADIADVVGTRLRRLSERVSTDGSTVFFDGDPIDSSIADYIIRALRAENADADEEDEEDNVGDESEEEQTSLVALVGFLEKLYQNPSAESIEHLYTFIRRYRLTIRPNGDFIAYKGLNDDFGSIHTGQGIVNGVRYTNASLDNTPGNVIEIARSKVDANRGNGCSTGLHAGTFAYARSFSQGKIVAVAINPRDVVSVPEDCAFQKLRVSRYEVLVEIPFDYERDDEQTVWDGDDEEEDWEDTDDREWPDDKDYYDGAEADAF